MRISKRRFISIVIVLTPVIDIVNALLRIYASDGLISFGQAARIIILLLLFKTLGTKSKYLLEILGLSILLLIRNAIYYAVFDASLINNIICDLRYLYVLTFGAAMSSLLREKKIDTEDIYHAIKICISIFAVTTIISNYLNIGFQYVNARRLFTEVNALTSILVWGSSIWLYELLTKKIKIKTIIMAIITTYTAISLGTKTGLFGIVAVFVYSLIYVGAVRRKAVRLVFALIVTVTGGMIICRYFISGSGMEAMMRWEYFYKKADLLTFLISGRNTLFLTAFQVWVKNPIYILFGVSFSLMNKSILSINRNINYAGAEMDLFDIGFYYGLFIFIATGAILGKRFFYSIKNVFNRNANAYFSFTFIVFAIISFLGGHVLSSPMAGIVFCSAYFLSKNRNRELEHLYSHIPDNRNTLN